LSTAEGSCERAKTVRALLIECRIVFGIPGNSVQHAQKRRKVNAQ
jgi:hypothetical protein